MEVPKSVTVIEPGVFRNCYALSSVTLPNTLTTVGLKAFTGCIKLQEITIPEGVQTIGEAAFYDCRQLTTVVLPSTLQRVERDAFLIHEDPSPLKNVYYAGDKAAWKAVKVVRFGNEPDGFTNKLVCLGDEDKAAINTTIYNWPGIWLLVGIAVVLVIAIVVIILIVKSKKNKKES